MSCDWKYGIASLLSKTTRLKALNYIPTSCTKFLDLVTFLNLAIMRNIVTFPLKFIIKFHYFDVLVTT